MNEPAFSAAASAITDAPDVLPTRGPPASSGREKLDEGSRAPAPPPDIRHLTEGHERIWPGLEEHERIAHDLNDIVVRRIFAAGLDLQAALLLIGNHCAGSRIHDAVGQLDQAIVDIRDTVFGLRDARPI
jgi:signal transduction histidine kinase